MHVSHERHLTPSFQVFVVQHVDVCMFSNGKFKNVVALVTSREECPLGPGSSLSRTYTLHPAKGATKNWIALEDSFSRAGATLASTITCASNSPEDRNVFAIYVSYYVKVKLLLGAMGGELALKLPFTLMHSTSTSELTESLPLPPPQSRPVKEESPPSEKTQKTDRNKEEDLIVKCDEGPTWELESSEWTLSGDAPTCDLVSVTNTRDRCNETAESHLSNNNNNNNYNKLIVRRVLCCFTTKGKKWQRNTSCTCHCDVPRHWPVNCFVAVCPNAMNNLHFTYLIQ